MPLFRCLCFASQVGLLDIQIRETSILCEDAQTLIAALDRELMQEYAPEHRHTVDFESFHANGGFFVVAYDEAPVACGALRPLTDEDVELKRMFVTPSHRGRGISRRVLTFLEDKAREQGFCRLVLETGDQQTAAMNLYGSAGYRRVDPFGEYAKSERSICFAKDLRGAD